MTSHDHLPPAPLNSLDQDIRDVNQFPVSEKLEFIADLFNDWRHDGPRCGTGISVERPAFESSWRFLVDEKIVERSRKERADGIVFSVLPDIPHPLDGSEGEDTIRSVGKLHDEFYRTDNGAVFIPLAQGYMVEVPSERQQFYQMYISQCSCIVGYGAERTVVAHISFSVKSEVDAVLAHMKEIGISDDDVYVVASQTPGQTAVMNMPVVTEPEYYVERGVKGENIIPFEHRYCDGKQDLAGVTIAPDGIRVAKYLYSYDSRATLGDPREVVVKQTSH